MKTASLARLLDERKKEIKEQFRDDCDSLIGYARELIKGLDRSREIMHTCHLGDSLKEILSRMEDLYCEESAYDILEGEQELIREQEEEIADEARKKRQQALYEARQEKADKKYKTQQEMADKIMEQGGFEFCIEVPVHRPSNIPKDAIPVRSSAGCGDWAWFCSAEKEVGRIAKSQKNMVEAVATPEENTRRAQGALSKVIERALYFGGNS